ncbi:T3SS (YopN, CesT) and YbjN peptide-binding chaperone 1 [Micromonospora citrea]|uniref:T3SS (YopN, CesT) and YbjN peptide-binding chaperone 1 n=1 Tax=Micromonospora citrea TaxID=47855 RepID=UPI003C3FC9A7
MTAEHPSKPASDQPGAAPEHHESVLLDEPTTADLRAKVTEAWREFARALAERLRDLPAGAHLELTLDPTASGTGDAVYSVSVDVAEGRVVARAVGNATLPQGYRLDRAAVADMIALGWSPPGVLAGSGEDFGLEGSTEDASKLAALLSRTLRDVYGAPHPAFLVYLVHDAQGESLPVEPLGTARSEFGPDRDVEADLDEALAAAATAQGGDNDVLALEERVRTVVSTMLKSKSDALQVDSDGDINIRAGSAMVFVRVRDNPPLVDVFSPVLTEVEPTERLYVKLSELTNRMPIGRLYCADDTVWASIPVFGRNFQATHLMLAVQVMTGLADELDDRLHGEFGGKRFFGEGDKPSRPAAESDHRTGMYL